MDRCNRAHGKEKFLKYNKASYVERAYRKRQAKDWSDNRQLQVSHPIAHSRAADADSGQKVR